MKPIFADAIDFPLVLALGLAVLVPLMLFQILVEAFVLSRAWNGSFRELTGFALRANCWSLLAGIPTKVLNAAIYGTLLPEDIPGFFVAYPWLTALGTLIYFAVTLAVEGLYARRRLRVELPRRLLWRGILLANLATYAVLAPLHYFATRPMMDVRSFTRDASWSSSANTAVVYIDGNNGQLKSVRIGRGREETIVPARVKDYLLSADYDVCLYRGEGGTLVLYERTSGTSNLVWQTDERFGMNQVAFSPSATLVAIASEKERLLHVVRASTGQRSSLILPADTGHWSVAWSLNEDSLLVSAGTSERFTIQVAADFGLTCTRMTDTNNLRLLSCYGRIGPGRWFSGDEWGQSFSRDECGDLRVWSFRGLTSSVRAYREGQARKNAFVIAVNPGLLHLSTFYFGDVAFLDGCDELILEANGGIYLVDFKQRRLGTVVAKGKTFSLMSPRFQKRL